MSCFVLLGALFVPCHQSIAQYPGSAGSYSNSGFGASTSSSSTSSSSSGNSSESYANSSQNIVADSPAISYGLETNSYADDRDDDEQIFHPTSSVRPGKTERKRVLIKKFRNEFAKTAIVETTNLQQFKPQKADIYLSRFADELAEGLESVADRKSLAHDLALVREAIDTRLDCLIAANTSEKTMPSALFAKKSVLGGDPSILDEEIKQLLLKHELMQFGELGLQALGSDIK